MSESRPHRPPPRLQAKREARAELAAFAAAWRARLGLSGLRDVFEAARLLVVREVAIASDRRAAKARAAEAKRKAPPAPPLVEKAVFQQGADPSIGVSVPRTRGLVVKRREKT